MHNIKRSVKKLRTVSVTPAEIVGRQKLAGKCWAKEKKLRPSSWLLLPQSGHRYLVSIGFRGSSGQEI